MYYDLFGQKSFPTEIIFFVMIVDTDHSVFGHFLSKDETIYARNRVGIVNACKYSMNKTTSL